MALSVVAVAKGGLPVVALPTHGGLPVIWAAQGIPVTIVASGGLPTTFVTLGGSVVVPVPPGAPSYTNPGGSGNRTSSVTITTTVALGGGAINALVDGSQADTMWFQSGEVNKIITFDFGVGASKKIDEFKWYQSGTGGQSQGVWRFGGSNDNSTYTEFPETCQLGVTAPLSTFPVTNTNAYRYYRLRQTSGSTNSGPFIREIEFKIG